MTCLFQSLLIFFSKQNCVTHQMDQPCADTLFFHGKQSRNAFESSAQLQYQDIRAIQDNGIHFDVLSALTELDV